MAAATNTVLTFAMVGAKESVRDTIYIVSPDETPILAALPDGPKPKNVKHQWQTDSFAAPAANAQLQGDDVTIATSSNPSMLENHCQILRKSCSVSGTAMAIQAYGRSGSSGEMMRIWRKKVTELRRDLEFNLFGNQAPVAGNATTAVQARPMVGWYKAANVSAGADWAAGTTTAAATDGTARALTEAIFVATLQKLYDAAGARSRVALLGSYNSGLVSKFTGNTQNQATVDKRTASAVINVYESDFGRVTKTMSRNSRARDLHIIDPEYLELCYLRKEEEKDMGVTGDNTRMFITTEVTLAVLNPDAHGAVLDCTTSA